MCGCNSLPTPLPPEAPPYYPPVPAMMPGRPGFDISVGGDPAAGRICSQKPGVADPWTGKGSVDWTCCSPPAGRFKVQACIKFNRPQVF